MKTTVVPSPVSSSVRGSPCASPSGGAWHAGRARKGKAVHGCPKDTHSHLIKASKRAGFSCPLDTGSLTIQALPHSAAASYPRGKWFSGKQILPAGQLPHQFNHYLIFKAFFPDFPSPQFPCTSQSKHRLCLSACFKQAGERKTRKQ